LVESALLKTLKVDNNTQQLSCMTSALKRYNMEMAALLEDRKDHFAVSLVEVP